MRYAEKQLKAPGPRLPIVLSQVSSRLQSDDWERFSTENGNRYYYIVGVEAFYAEVNGDADFVVWEIPGKPSLSPKQPRPVTEWYLRSQLASRHPDYLQRVRNRIENLGVSSDVVDAILKEGVNKANISRLLGELLSAGDVNHEVFCQFLDAYRVSKTGRKEIKLTQSEVEESDIAREKMYLEEIVKKYERMVDRGEQLQALSFQDAKLEEASKCYLYGFYRATVVLSASAVEMHLKRVTEKKRFDTYDSLINTAQLHKKIDKSHADFSRIIFNRRTDVVHRDAKVEHDTAKETLAIARKVIEYLKPPE